MIEFRYGFRNPGESREATEVVVSLDGETLAQKQGSEGAGCDWTRLEVAHCPGCPLRAEEHPHCPAALSLASVGQRFGELLSYEEVETTCVMRERTVTARTTAQRALSSLLGLLMATSGCPVLAKFRPMARFHLPFSTREETLFRTVGAYLVGQYFLIRQGMPGDLALTGLRDFYKEVHEINVGLGKRLRYASRGDAHINALVILDTLTQELPFHIEDNLCELEPVFAAFLEER